MALTKKEIEHIALLARLGLTEEEKEKFAQQLTSILDYIKQLQEVDTTNIQPLSQITGLSNVFRQDEVKQCDELTIQRTLRNAPDIEDGLIKTKSVFE